MNYRLISLASRRCDFICIGLAITLQIIFLFTSPLSEFGITYVSLYGGLIYIGIAWGIGLTLLGFLDPFLEKKVNEMKNE